MPFADLTKAIADAHAALAASPRAELVRGARIAVWAALGPYELAYDANGEPAGALRTIGLRRRHALAELCVQRVLPIWERVIGTRDPHEMPEVASQYLSGRISRDAARERANQFSACLDHAYTLSESEYHASYAGYAARNLVSIVLADEDMDDPEMSDAEFEYEQWDCALTACAAEAGDLPWGEYWDAARGRAFWTWYLDEAVPGAWQSVAEV